MSRSSRVRLARGTAREVTYGVIVSQAQDEIRRTGGEPTSNQSAEASAVVRSDLKTVDVIRLDREAGLTIEDELVYGVHDKEIEDALGSTFQTPLAIDGAAGDVSALAADNSFNSTTADKFNLIQVGQAIRTFGFTTPANNGVFVVLSRTTGAAPKMVVAGGTLVNETPAGAAAKFRGSFIRESTSRLATTFEFAYIDLSPVEYWAYPGSVCRSMRIGFQHPGRITAAWDYMSQKPQHGAGTSVGNGTVNAYDSAKRSLNSSDAWKAALEGGVALTPKVKELQLNIARGVTKLDGAGVLGAQDMGIDSYNMTATFRVRNDVAAGVLADKVHNFTPSSFQFQLADPDDNILHFHMPRLVYTSEGIPGAGPKDSDVFVPMPFTIAMHPTLGFMFQITKLPATAA